MKLKIEITERKFKGFIKDGRLTKPKTYIAKYFGIHVQTLRSWMKREGYGHLIGVMRGRPDKPKKEPIPPKEIDGVKHLTPEALEFKEVPDDHPDKVDINFDDI